MNDYLENKWIKNIIKKIEMRKNRIENILFTNPIKKVLAQYSSGSFIVSFSLHKDMLSQWRGYASDGSGVAIGINTSCLNPIDRQFNYNAFFNKIIYNELEQKEIIHNIFNHYFDLFNNCINSEKYKNTPPNNRSISIDKGETVQIFEVLQGKTDYAQEENYYINKCISELLLLSPFLKNDAFSEESEYRLCHFPDFEFLEKTENLFSLKFDDINFRISNNKIIPFYSINFLNTKNFIKEIILGPKCQTNEKVLRDFLNANDLVNIKIKKSKASYQ